MMTICPSAYYDTMAIVARLSHVLAGVAISEVHLFAYLACLLSLYRQRTVADWGYGFVATESGSPYAPDIENAITILVTEGFIVDSDRYLTLSSAGTEEYATMGELHQNSQREEFLDGACSSALSLPIGTIRTAITTDKNMKLASQLGNARRLLNESAVEEIHDAFAALSEKIGIAIHDLMVPAVVWLNYLAQVDRDQQTGTAEGG